jgi:fructose-1,6-bisphosphatase/inositol monophosphatase family enzyme
MDAEALLPPLLALHGRIRTAVVDACAGRDTAPLAAVSAEESGDTIYGIDRVSEEVLVEGMAALAVQAPICVVAEGLPGGEVVLPRGAREADCRWRVLVDPIDGTRGLMYQKRSGWILTGVAPNRGTGTRLRDIVLAVQTEIPLLKQHLSDQIWAVRGRGVEARRFDRLTGSETPLRLAPSTAATISHGFATVVRFFPGARDILAAIDDELALELLGPAVPGKAACFEDQYACTGGQLYELMTGHDRFIADLRPLLEPVLASRGAPKPLCCHPYDLATVLIAEELGVVLTDAVGASADAPFDVTTDVTWVGYANAALREAVEPVLQRALRRHRLLPT